VVVVALLAAPAVAKPEPPCPHCTLDVPAKADKAIPLVVLLHGDRQKAPALAAWWRSAVVERGWALLSLQCPTNLGCKDSWWQWNGDPSWVADQAGKVDGIDRSRVYLVGWSGGASYIGDRGRAWEAWFAAVVIHGGGVPPDDETCPAALPAYFLVGDNNPLHRHAVSLRGFYDGCKQDVTWDLVRGADHEREEQALTAKKARIILDWMASHTLASH
jgi:poly(3-hydroxybutyrate) depolymerase